MQDHATERPLGGAGVDNGVAVEGEVRGRGGAGEGLDLRQGCGGFVGRTRLAGGGRTGDTAAPRVSRLRAATPVGIGERVAGWDVHQDEGRERDGEAARFQIADRVDNGLVGRCAAIGSLAVVG